MLTGDKLETAVNVAKSAGLVKRAQPVYIFNSDLRDRQDIYEELNKYRKYQETTLVILGKIYMYCCNYCIKNLNVN